MKIVNYYSIISILISFALIISKLIWEIEIFYQYIGIIENRDTTQGISPSMVAGHIKFFLSYILIPLMLSGIFMIIGIFKQSKYRFTALVFMLLTFVCSLIPFGLIIIMNYG